MLRTGLRIGDHRLKIGLKRFPDSGLVGVFGDLGWRLALPQRLAQALKREVETRALPVALSSLLPIAEQIDRGLRRAIYPYRDAFDAVLLYTGAKHLLAEADNLQRRLRHRRAPKSSVRQTFAASARRRVSIGRARGKVSPSARASYAHKRTASTVRKAASMLLPPEVQPGRSGTMIP